MHAHVDYLIDLIMNSINIETGRLLLKGISDTEMNRIFSSYPKEEIMQMLGHRTEGDFLKEEEKYKQGYASYNRRFILFMMTLHGRDDIIGRCGFHNWNPDHRRAELGYVMEDESSKRKGLMSEAVVAVVDFGFSKLNLHRIEALIGTNNLPSLKIIEKLGFTQEGLLRKHYLVNDVFEDSLVFSKLAEEYFQ
jgi:ribosomal-protein-alanine N-acetyltransferase